MTDKKTRIDHFDSAIADRRISVSAQKAALILPFVSTDNIRYYLGGLFIEPHPKGGVLMVATDGRRLAAIHDPDGEADGGWICPVPKVLAAACRRQNKKYPKDNAGMLHFIGDAGYVTAANFPPESVGTDMAARLGPLHLASAWAPPIDGRYPDWRRVVPAWPLEQDFSEPIGFSGKLLSAFSVAAKAAGYSNAATVFYPPGKQGAMIVRLPHVPDFLGLLMPMAVYEDTFEPDGLPGWLIEGPGAAVLDDEI